MFGKKKKNAKENTIFIFFRCLNVSVNVLHFKSVNLLYILNSIKVIFLGGDFALKVWNVSLFDQILLTSTSIPGMRGRLVWWTHSFVWPTTSTHPPSTSHGPRMEWSSQRAWQTYVIVTIVMGHSTWFLRFCSLQNLETIISAWWSIKLRKCLSARAGVGLLPYNIKCLK